MSFNVSLFIYRRPELTKRVFEKIAAAKPDRLFIIADGPRNAQEIEKCELARAVVGEVDWDCEVLKNFSDVNMGCRKRVSTGLDWVFKNVEEAIILEDDCMPHPSFFRYCEEMLAAYKSDERIAYISGNNYVSRWCRTPNSCTFSIYGGIWGWATWARAWKLFDADMSGWPDLRDEGWHRKIFPDKRVADHFSSIWDAVHSGALDSWAYSWFYTTLKNNMLAVSPSCNLVSNAGFGKDATQTVVEGYFLGDWPVDAMRFPLDFPAEVKWNVRFDRMYEKKILMKNDAYERIFSDRLFNKHWYGGALRRVPLVGRMWARMREQSKHK